VLRVKKYFSFLCRVTRKFDERQENEEAVGFMLGLEDGDGAFYCQVSQRPSTYNALFFHIKKADSLTSTHV
jgi:hypothetical protein